LVEDFKGRKTLSWTQCVKNPQPTFEVEALSTVELASELAMTKVALRLQECKGTRSKIQ